MKIIKGLFEKIIGILWPNLCLNCNELPQHNGMNLCNKCNELLFTSLGHRFCTKCAAIVENPFIADCPLCKTEQFAFDSIVVVGRYDAVLRKLIIDLKNNRKFHLDGFLSFMLKEKFLSSEFSDKADMIVPVPLHWTKEFARGFNQSELLALSLKSNNRPICKDLVRIRRTKPQFMLSPHQRLANIKGAFAVRKDHRLAGKNICLIDDIKTTGATLNECASVLKEAGAAKVYAMVLSAAV